MNNFHNDPCSKTFCFSKRGAKSNKMETNMTYNYAKFTIPLPNIISKIFIRLSMNVNEKSLCCPQTREIGEVKDHRIIQENCSERMNRT